MEEITFTYNIRQKTFGIKTELEQTQTDKAIAALAQVQEETALPSFTYLGVNEAEVDKIVARVSVDARNPWRSLAQALKSMKPSEIKQACEKAVSSPELVPFAEQLFLRKCFEKAGLYATLAKKAVEEALPVSAPKPEKWPFGKEEGITFSAKFGDWVAIKKMTIDKLSKNPEIAYMLSGVNETATRKGFELLGVSGGPLEAAAAQATRGKRKSFGALLESLENLADSTLEDRLRQGAAQKGSKTSLERAFLARSLLKALSYDVVPDSDTLQKVYPELKFPKPKGRFGKAKK